MNPKGKTALVTGGAHRVGKAITMGLASAGANVIVNYYSSESDAEQTVQEAQALGVDAMAIQCDVSDYASVLSMAEQIQGTFGGVDIIVNSSSYFGQTPFPSDEPDVRQMWQRVTRILIDGPYFICNALVPSMQRRGGGAIVNIIDLSVWQPAPNFLAHSVGKGGLLSFTQALALELAPSIRVNAIAPGLIEPPAGFGKKTVERYTKQNLMQRWSGGGAVAQAVNYLIEAEFVTGEVLTVDGGERLTR